MIRQTEMISERPIQFFPQHASQHFKCEICDRICKRNIRNPDWSFEHQRMEQIAQQCFQEMKKASNEGYNKVKLSFKNCNFSDAFYEAMSIQQILKKKLKVEVKRKGKEDYFGVSLPNMFCFSWKDDNSHIVENWYIPKFKPKDVSQQRFNQLWQQALVGQGCDVTLKVGEEVFTAHKHILMSWSPHFKAVFSSRMIESSAAEVVIKETTPQAFKALLEFIYTNKIEYFNRKEISLNQLSDILDLADLYVCEDLKTLCCDKMSSCINLENFISIITTALNGKKEMFVKVCLLKVLNDSKFLKSFKTLLFEISDENKQQLLQISEKEKFERLIKLLTSKKFNSTKSREI